MNLSTRQAAERLKVTPEWVWKLVQDGKLKRPEGIPEKYVTLESVERYERERKPPGKPSRA